MRMIKSIICVIYCLLTIFMCVGCSNDTMKSPSADLINYLEENISENVENRITNSVEIFWSRLHSGGYDGDYLGEKMEYYSMVVIDDIVAENNFLCVPYVDYYKYYAIFLPNIVRIGNSANASDNHLVPIIFVADTPDGVVALNLDENNTHGLKNGMDESFYYRYGADTSTFYVFDYDSNKIFDINGEYSARFSRYYCEDSEIPNGIMMSNFVFSCTNEQLVSHKVIVNDSHITELPTKDISEYSLEEFVAEHMRMESSPQIFDATFTYGYDTIKECPKYEQFSFTISNNIDITDYISGHYSNVYRDKGMSIHAISLPTECVNFSSTNSLGIENSEVIEICRKLIPIIIVQKSKSDGSYVIDRNVFMIYNSDIGEALLVSADCCPNFHVETKSISYSFQLSDDALDDVYGAMNSYWFGG